MSKVLIILCLSLTGCFTTIPLGENGKYGSVRVDVNYIAPINLFQPAPKFLPDK